MLYPCTSNIERFFASQRLDIQKILVGHFPLDCPLRFYSLHVSSSFGSSFSSSCILHFVPH